ncbi:hypothetical protein AAG906_018265 [Vitis piasezkii]
MSSSFTTPMRIEGVVENYVDILPGNDDDNVELFDEDNGKEDIMDMGNNENTKMIELNWDVINSMVNKLTTRIRLWNESNELFKGLWFETKEYKPLLGILVLDGTCLMHTIDIVLGMWLDAKKWTLTHDGGHRYGWMTKNIAKYINEVLKRARMLPITALV